MRRVMFDRAGEPDVLRIIEDVLASPGPGEVRVDIRMIGLNRFETQFRRDAYAIAPVLPSPIGAEGVGIVSVVGPGTNGFAVGDRVTVLPINPAVGTGLYADAANVPVISLVRSLDGSSDAQEASFWCAFLTAYGLLTEAPLPAGSWVLFTAAASSVGLALIQVARAMGLRPIATTRSPAKVAALETAGAEHVVITDHQSIPEEIARITGGAGVAFAADALAGRFLRDVVAATAMGGAVRIYGALSEPSMRATRIDLEMFALYRKTVGFSSVYSVISDPARFAAAQAYLRERFRTGIFVPRIDREFALADIVEAHRYLEKGGQIGKVICRP